MGTPEISRGGLRHWRNTLLLAGAMYSAAAGAAPTGGQLAGGQATIANTPGLTTINQASPAAIINWQQFNIGTQESVVFRQPSASSTALNRVVGGSAAQILGSLTANGRVFLLDPQGVVFGRDAMVDVGGLVASTLAIRDDDFLAGRYRFTSADAAGGQVGNAGTLVARDGGFVVLSGNDVRNSGLVQARLGHVLMASGSELTLDFNGDGLLSYAVTQPASAGHVDNTGSVLADGGVVALTASSAGAVVGAVVNNSGLVQARSIEHRGGSIFLSGNGGDVTNAGRIDASGVAGASGGEVALNSTHDIDLARGSAVDVSGARGGSMRAIATRLLTTEAGSQVSAASTSDGGSAGFVELSGHQSLLVRGGLLIGRGGRLLLDPTDLIIADGSGATTGTSTVTMFEQNVINVLRGGADVDLNADHSVTFNNLSQPLDGRNNGNGGALAVTLNDGSGAGGRIFFSDVTDSVLADKGVRFDAHSGSMQIGNITGASVTLQADGAVSAGSLTATHGGIGIFADHASLTTGALSATNITTDSSAANADVAVYAGDSVTVNGAVSTDAEVHNGNAICSSGCASASGKIDLHSNSSFSHGSTSLSVNGAISARAVSGGAYVAEVTDPNTGNTVTPSQGDANAAVTVLHHDPFSGAPSLGVIDTHAIQATAIASAADAALNARVTIGNDGGGVDAITGVVTAGHIDTHGGAVIAGGFDAAGNAIQDAGSITITNTIGTVTTASLTATRSTVKVRNGDFGGGNTPADTVVTLGALSGGTGPQQLAYELSGVDLLSGGTLNLTSPGTLHAGQVTVSSVGGDFNLGAITTSQGGVHLEAAGGRINVGAIITGNTSGPADVELISGSSLTTGDISARNSSITVDAGDFNPAGGNLSMGVLSGGGVAGDQLINVKLRSGGSMTFANANLVAGDINLQPGGALTAHGLTATSGRVAITGGGDITILGGLAGTGCGSAHCVSIDGPNVLLRNTGGALALDGIDINQSQNVDVFHAVLTLRGGSGTTVNASSISAGTIDIADAGPIALSGSTFSGERIQLVSSGGPVAVSATRLTDFGDVNLAAATDLTLDNATIGPSATGLHGDFFTLVARAGTSGQGGLLLSNATQLASGSVLLAAAGDIRDDGQAGNRIDSNALGVGTSGDIDLAATQLIAGRGAAPIGGDPELVELQQSQRQQRTNTLDQEGFAPVASFIGRTVTLGSLSLKGTYVDPPPPEEGGPYGHYIYFQTDALTLQQNVDAPTDVLVQFVPFTQGASIGIEQVQSNNRMVNFGVDTQLSKFPGTTFAFGSSSYNGNIYSGEDAPVDVTSQGSGAENFVFLSSGSVNGKDNIFTNGEVVVLQAPDDFEIPLFNQFQPGADDDEDDSAETSGAKKDEGGAAKAVRVRLPRGSVVRRTRLGARECR